MPTWEFEKTLKVIERTLTIIEADSEGEAWDLYEEGQVAPRWTHRKVMDSDLDMTRVREGETL